MLPDRAVPSASLIEISPSSANASSAVTTRPGFQTKPEARDRCECTETIDGVARATTLATAEESEERTPALGSVMAKTPVGADPNLGSAEALRNYPDGHEHALQANFPCPPPKWPFPQNIFPVSSDGQFPGYAAALQRCSMPIRVRRIPK